MESYKGRKLEFGQLVQVYRNLHNNKFSIRDAKTKLVLAYADSVTLSDCTFIVNKNGQKKAREQQQRNVHAYVQGYIHNVDTIINMMLNTLNEITYNPFRYDYFIDIKNEIYVHESQVAHCQNGKVYIIKNGRKCS